MDMMFAGMAAVGVDIGDGSNNTARGGVLTTGSCGAELHVDTVGRRSGWSGAV